MSTGPAHAVPWPQWTRLLKGTLSQQRVLSPSAGQAQGKLPTPLPREPASEPDAPAGKFACAPIAEGTDRAVIPIQGEEGDGSRKDALSITQQSRFFWFCYYYLGKPNSKQMTKNYDASKVILEMI